MTQTEDRIVHLILNPPKIKRAYKDWQLPIPTPEDVQAAEQRGEAITEAYNNDNADLFEKYGVPPLVVRRKVCDDCKRKRPIHHFSKNHFSIDGYLGRCKDCIKAKRKKK